MAIHFTIQRAGRALNAQADAGPPFFVGFKTAYEDKKTGEDFEGLYNTPTKELPKLRYDASAARPTFGFWADFIAPTAACEGGNFLTLNTYDRARFTWGFAQFGAHVPDGDFVLFFRDLLTRPEAQTYFPNLVIKANRIVKVEGAREVPLETASTTRPLMDYLNPTTSAVEDAEVIAGAKFIHWASRFEDARLLQVFHTVRVFRNHMTEADSRLHLDGRTADLCLVVCDIRHQGRAKYDAMQAALADPTPLDALLRLGALAYPDRIRTLKKEIASRKTLLSGKTWSRSMGDFV